MVRVCTGTWPRASWVGAAEDGGRPYPVAHMTSLANTLTDELARANTYDALSTTVGAVTVLLLLALLLCKEVIRATRRPDRAGAMRILDAGIVPLLATAGVVVTARLAELI